MAVYRLLSFPLTQESRQALFIPTDLPENRTKLFKPMKDLQRLHDDDPDVSRLISHFSMVRDPEQYYHSQLLLYLPWRNEATDLLQPTYQLCHRDNSDIIRENKARFEYHAEAMKHLEEFGAPEENWGDIAAQNEQARVK